MRLRLEAGAEQRLVTGTGLGALRNELDHTLVIDGNGTSALGEGFEVTPMVVPVRGRLDSIKRLLKGDRSIGRGSRQHFLGKCRYCNTCKVSQYGRSVAISGFREALLSSLCLSVDVELLFKSSSTLRPLQSKHKLSLLRRIVV